MKQIIRIKIDEKVELKALEISDARVIFETIENQREHLNKWLPFIQHTQKYEDTYSFVEDSVDLIDTKKECVFTILYDNKFIGLVGVQFTKMSSQKTEIGYWISKEYEGKGIVTKVVKEVCRFAFDKLGLNRIQINCAAGNTRSRNVPKRLGFVFEGLERDGEFLAGNQFVDLENYSLLRKEFER